MSDAAIECSASSRRTAGLNGARAAGAPDAGCGTGDAALAGAADAALAGAGAGAVSSIGAASNLRLKRASTSSGITSASTCLSTSTRVPSAGAGISTVTLSVSSSSSGSSLTTVSPTCLHQRKIVARVPSSLGGTSTSARWAILDFRQGFDRTRYRRNARQHLVEQDRTMGTGDVRHGEPLDRCVEIEERFPGDHRGNLRAEAGGHGVLMNDQAAAGLAHRGQRRVAIPGRQGPQVQMVGGNTRFGDGALAAFDHGAPTDDRERRAFAQNAGLAERHHEVVAGIGAPRPTAVEQ